jgi:Calx-beta domain
VDSVVEDDESFTVTLAGVTGTVNVVDGTAIGTILNDDQPPVVPNLSIADASGSEDSGSLSFTVSLDVAAADVVTFMASTTDGTALVSDADYSPLVDFAGSIPEGELTTTVTVTLGVDSDVEPDETFTVALASVTGPVNLADGIATGTILNDDATGGGGPVPIVTWSPNSGGVSTAGNVISYSGSPSGWFQNSVNSQPLANLGFVNDFEVRFTLGNDPTGTTWIVGLGTVESGWAWNDPEYGLRSSNGKLVIYESGTWRTGSDNMSAGDVISIYVNNGAIEYRLNGVTVYTSSYTGEPPFYVDTAFLSGAMSMSVEAQGTMDPVTPPNEQPITVWNNLAGGVSVVDDDLTYSGSPTNWTNTGYSAPMSTLGASSDYTVSWTIGSSPSATTWIVGLGVAEEPGVESWRDVDYGMRSSEGTLNIRTSGTWIAGGGPLAAGDVLSIHVSGTLLEYRLNNATIATSTTTGTEDFYVDTAFKNGAISLNDFTLTQ